MADPTTRIPIWKEAARGGYPDADSIGLAGRERMRRAVQGIMGDCFAGHCDWRLPTVGERRTVTRPGGTPCIDPIFGLNGEDYWTASTPDFNEETARVVSFTF